MTTGPRVAVVDSGWARHVAEPRVHTGVGLVDPADELRPLLSGDDADRIGHGTACADLILRLAPRAQVLPIRVFGRRLETSAEILIEALDWARGAGVRVVNVSLGTLRTDALPALYAACDRARRAGLVIVAAHAMGAPATYPAAFDNVLSVSSASRTGGRRIVFRPGAAVELLAPDRHQLRWGDGHRRYVRGSSFAAPVITAMVARMLHEEPDLDIEGVRSLLGRHPDMMVAAGTPSAPAIVASWPRRSP
ncbi:MAG TPA: S8 family serine peptidase [Gemmatimonadales bacterium]